MRKQRNFRLPLSTDRVVREIDEEIAFHVDERTEDLVARGIPRDTAREQALREFGDLDAARAEIGNIDRRRVRRTLRVNWWGDFAQDLRYGTRAALRAPLFSLLAVVTLALGIGANAAVFGVVKSVLLDPLPFAEQAQLVRISSQQDGTEWGLSAGLVRDVDTFSNSFTETAAFQHSPMELIVGDADGVSMVKATWVEPGFFEVLGLGPMLGRAFNADDLVDGRAQQVILTYEGWQRLAGGRASVLGSDIMVNGFPRTVIGVLPREFVGPIGETELYFALNLAPVLESTVSARRSFFLGQIGRLRNGVGPDALRADLAAVDAAIAREYPDDIKGIELQGEPLRDAMVGDVKTPLIILLASAGLVLLIACANLAGALLSRVIARRKEFAVRAALGAGYGRLLRQLLTESSVLAVAGGAVGVVLAATLLAVARGFIAPALPHFAGLALDGGALGIILALTLATGLAIGVLPALALRRANPQQGISGESRGSSEGRGAGRLRGVLVAAQIALCLSLVVSAGLLARSLWSMATAPMGLDASGVTVAATPLPGARYETPESRVQFHQQIVEQLAALPGVTAVATANHVPRGDLSNNTFVIDGRPWPAGQAEPWAEWTAVSDGYFDLLRIPLLQGRGFDGRDILDGDPVTVINETMARRYWPNGDAIGARIRIGPDVNAPFHTIVGVVGDVRNDAASATAAPMTYGTVRQGDWGTPYVFVRAAGAIESLPLEIERAVAAVDPGVPTQRITALETLIGEGLADLRLPVMLMMAFGGLALLLASVGIYAMFATMAAAREREFGIRMALGADGSAIARLVLRQGGLWLGLGLVVGALGVFGAARILRDLLFGVAPFDPLTLGVTILLITLCAAAALLTPLRRVTRVDPAVTLRAD